MAHLRRIRGLSLRSIAVAIACLACGGVDTPEEIRELHAEQRFGESLEPLRDLLLARPDDPELNYLYGVALIRSGEPRSAVWSLRKAAEHPDWRVRAGMEIASNDLRAGNWSKAIEEADRVLEAEPDHIPALFVRGEARLSDDREIEVALGDFERILEQNPDHHRAELSRMAALIMLDRIDEAVAAVEEMDESVQEDALDRDLKAQLCAIRAVFQAERGEVDAAEASFGACIERFPAVPVVLDQAIRFFDARDASERATGLLEHALESFPESMGLRSRLAARLRDAGDPEGAEAVLRAGLEIDAPQLHAAIWTELTNHFLVLDDVPAAVECYEQALALSPDPPAFAILSYADMLARAGEHERALEIAAQLDNDSYRGLIEARVHLNEGRPAEALARLDTVLPTWPDNAGARYYAARAAEQVGDFGRAIEEYRQSLRSGPEQTEAGLRLAKLYWAAGALSQAWTGATHHYRAQPADPEGLDVLMGLAVEGGEEQTLTMLQRYRQTPLWPRALALHAEALAGTRGPEAAIEEIRSQSDLDLTDPAAAPVLRALVVALLAANRVAEARASVEQALAAHPDAADFHEIRGRVLAGAGAPQDEQRAAYRRAVELDPRRARALAALAGLAERTGDLAEAIEYYDRASAARPEDPEPGRRAAELVERQGQLAEAEKRWEALLAEHPWDAGAAAALARLRVARGDVSERSLEIAQRAVMFRGGPEAQELLLRVYDARGESDEATALRERLEAVKPEPAVSPTDG